MNLFHSLNVNNVVTERDFSIKTYVLAKQRLKIPEMASKQLYYAHTMAAGAQNKTAIFVIWIKSYKIIFLHVAYMYQLLLTCKDLK